MKSKVCTKCKIDKPLSEFSKRKASKDGLRFSCKNCVNSHTLNYFKSIPGLITRIYNNQILHSEYRNHPYPEYSKKEFKEWLVNNEDFKELYKTWVISNYDGDLVPSVDRIDDNFHYKFDNIQVLTWGKNRDKGFKTKPLNLKSIKSYLIKVSKSGEHSEVLKEMCKEILDNLK